MSTPLENMANAKYNINRPGNLQIIRILDFIRHSSFARRAEVRRRRVIRHSRSSYG